MNIKHWLIVMVCGMGWVNSAVGELPIERQAHGPTSGATLTWVAIPAGVDVAGQLVVLQLRMSDLGTAQAAGFQAFVRFDNTRLSFVAGNYTDTPFGLPILAPIIADGEHIDLAAGVNDFAGQPPTSDDALLVELVFETLVPGCVTGLTFREHNPPTRITNPSATAIEPLALLGLSEDSPDPDFNDDGVVDPNDLALLLGAWGPCTTQAVAGECFDPQGLEPCLQRLITGGLPEDVPCPADLNCDGEVGSTDLAQLLGAWGPV